MSADQLTGAIKSDIGTIEQYSANSKNTTEYKKRVEANKILGSVSIQVLEQLSKDEDAFINKWLLKIREMTKSEQISLGTLMETIGDDPFMYQVQKYHVYNPQLDSHIKLSSISRHPGTWDPKSIGGNSLVIKQPPPIEQFDLQSILLYKMIILCGYSNQFSECQQAMQMLSNTTISDETLTDITVPAKCLVNVSEYNEGVFTADTETPSMEQQIFGEINDTIYSGCGNKTLKQQY